MLRIVHNATVIGQPTGSMFVPGQGFLFLGVLSNFKLPGDFSAVDLDAICIEVCCSIKTGKTPERFFVAHISKC